MHGLRHIRALVIWPLVCVMLVLSGPLATASAALVGTEQVIDKPDITAQRDKVQAFLARDDVKRRLTEFGVNADEAGARVDGLSEAEVQQLAAQIDGVPAGQGAGSVAVILLLIVLLILVWPFN
jgi:hypothetical protein